MRIPLGWGLAVLLLVGSPRARADDTPAPSTEVPHRWALGLQVQPLDLPSGHLGIPFSSSEDGYHLAASVTLRYQAWSHWALNAGVGLPTSALGPAVWVGLERSGDLFSTRGGLVTLVAYEDSGVELGFAGPDYFARKDGTFVGYAYAFGGAASLALRLPVGLRAEWANRRFDTYVEAAALLTLAPSPETLFDLAFGARVHF